MISSARPAAIGSAGDARTRVCAPHSSIPLGLGLAALAMRLSGIRHESLWLDEGYTLLFSRLPFPQLFLVGGAHEHPPLYYLIVHELLAIHDSYLIPRYVSAVAGALSVVVLYLLGARLGGRLAGLTAAALLLVSPFQLWYSQDGRGYELAGLFVLLSYYAVFCALDRPDRRFWIAYAVCTAAALYTEYTTVLVLLPQALLLFRASSSGLGRPLILSWLGAGLLFAPWLGVLGFDAAGIAADYWIPAPSPSTVANTTLEFLGVVTPCPSPPCSGHELSLPLLSGNEILCAAIAGLTVVVTGIAALLRRRLSSIVLSVWLLLPFCAVLALAVRRSLYLDRVFLDATFALYLLIGIGVAAFRRRPAKGLAAGAAAALIAACSLANLAPIYGASVNPDWKSAGRDFAAAYRPGQAVVFNPGVLRSLVSSYLPSGWHATSETPLWSRSYLDVPGWQALYPQPSNPDKLERQRIEGYLRDLQLARAASGKNRVWLITLDYPGMNDTRRWFSDHGFQPILSEEYDGDTRLELWSRSGPATLGPSVVPAGFVGWSARGHVRVRGAVARSAGSGELRRAFPIQPGTLYGASVEFRGIPPAAKPIISITACDASGHALGVFPRTQWYDFPIHGVWLEQPFGFVAPPGAARAVFSIRTGWGVTYWRNLAVYELR